MYAEIYYFSGTGNSLFVARKLAERLPGSRLIPVVGLLDGREVHSTAETVAFVFPVHALSVPLAVVRLLRRIDLSSARYIFAVATRMGLVFHGFSTIDRLLRRQQKHLSAQLLLTMGNNDVRGRGYRPPAEAEIGSVEEAVLRKLDSLVPIVRARLVRREEDSGYRQDVSPSFLGRFGIERTVVSLMQLSRHIGGVNYFSVDGRCDGCGICRKVCLSQKIRMVNRTPTWQKDVLCYLCYACVNFCPRQSVQVGSIPGVRSFTPENPRYQHPYASVADIARQRNPSPL